MALQESVAIRNARLDAHETTVGTAPILRLLNQTGVIPVDCAAAQTGTALTNITLPTDWMLASAAGVKAKTGTWQGTGIAAGDFHYWRLYDSTGTTCHYQGHISTAHAVSTAYALGRRVVNGTNLYRCTTAGTTGAASPPVHTTGAVADGTATWTYEGDNRGVITTDNPTSAVAQVVTVATFSVTSGNA